MFEKILVPYTGSEVTNRAFKTAMKIAKAGNSSITIISCVEKYYTFGFETKHDREVSEHHQQLMQKQIEKLKKEAQKAGVSFKSVVMKSNIPQKCITKHANENNIDLIVLGKSKLFPAEQYHHESVINYVYPNANCPVLIIK